MTKPNEPRGIALERADQIALIAVSIGILVVTGVLVGLLF